MKNLYRTLREWAARYEPATAKALLAAVFQILVVAGISLGNLPQVADAVLAFLALAATVVAGRSIRKSVYSPATHDAGVQVAHARGFNLGRRSAS